MMKLCYFYYFISFRSMSTANRFKSNSIEKHSETNKTKCKNKNQFELCALHKVTNICHQKALTQWSHRFYYILRKNQFGIQNMRRLQKTFAAAKFCACDHKHVLLLSSIMCDRNIVWELSEEKNCYHLNLSQAATKRRWKIS